MNLKIKQVLALALVLVVGFGAFSFNPHEVMAADVYPAFFGGSALSYSYWSESSWHYGRTFDVIIDSLEATDQVYCLAYYTSELGQSPHPGLQYYYFFSKSSFSFDYSLNVSANEHYGEECVKNHYDSVYDHTGTFKGSFYCFSLNAVAYQIDSYSIGYDYAKGDLSAYEVMNKILAGEEVEVDSSGASMYVNAVDELGYIQNITTATKNVNLAHANQHSIPVIKFSFSTTTSTGKKIYEDGMDVQYMLTARSFESESDYSQKNVYKSAKSDLFFVSENPNIFDEENSLNKGFFNFSAASDTWQSMYSELKDGMSFFANMVYDREFFIRPVYRESIFAPIKYGGWSRVVIDAFGKTHVVEGTIQGGENNPDATPDADGQLDDSDNQYDSDHKIGSGDNESDAESNSKDASDISVSDFVDSFKDFDLSSLSNILGQLGEAASAFADLLGVVLGWMPTWVRGSLFAAVCVWIFMLIKRAIF